MNCKGDMGMEAEAGVRTEALTDMQRENVAKWKEELRSGKYNQTAQMLKTSDGYCCLGLGLEKVVGKTMDVYFDQGNYTEYVYGHGKTSTLEFEDEYALGVDKECTWEEIEYLEELVDQDCAAETTRASFLATMNDNGYKFSDIADVIEKLGWDK